MRREGEAAIRSLDTGVGRAGLGTASGMSEVRSQTVRDHKYLII